MDAAMVAINTRGGRATGKDGMAMSRHGISMVFGLLTGFFLSGCAGEPDPRPIIVAEAKPALSPQTIDWAYKPAAIPLHVRASPDLNLYQGKPHVLKICVYQLSETRKFDDLRQSDAGVRKLMRCEADDPSISLAQSYFIQPAMDKTIPMDRAQGAKYVGIVAGYFNMTPEQVTDIVPYPVKVNTPFSPIFFWRSDTYEPGKLTLFLKLFGVGMALTGETNDG